MSGGESLVRAGVESEDTPACLESAKMLMLVNWETGKVSVSRRQFASEPTFREHSLLAKR